MKIILVLLGVVLFWGCSDNSSKTFSKIEKGEKDSLSMVIDSIRLANLHRNFIGRHNHALASGKKDLAEHAHQNPAKKRRWRKKQFAGVKAKRAAIQRRNREIAKQKEDSLK